MVYSVRCDKPIISSTPLRRTRTQSEHSKNVEQFLKANDVSITRDVNGKPVVKVVKRNG